MANRNFLTLALLLFSPFFLNAEDTPNPEQKTIVAFGDSLTMGYGLQADFSFPKKLEKALIKEGKQVKVIDAGVSGNISRDAKNRVDTVLAHNADLVIIEFGGNDIFRHIPAEEVFNNLDYVISEIKKTKSKILLCGISAGFTRDNKTENDYKKIYKELAKKHDLELFPDFLKGVAMKVNLNQPDLIHPNENGVDVIVGNILPSVMDLLD